MKHRIFLILSLCLILSILTGCGNNDTSVVEVSPSEATAAPTAAVPATEETSAVTEPEEIEIKDAASLALNGVRKLSEQKAVQLSYLVQADGILGTSAGEYFVKAKLDAARYFNDPDWEEHNYYSVTVGSKYQSVIEDFKIVNGNCYYKNKDNNAWTKNSSGITPMTSDGMPGLTLLNQIASGAVKADYSATPEEGYSLSVSLSGDSLRQIVKEYFTDLVGFSTIPENADWNSIQADVRIHFSIYNGAPDQVTVDSPELAALLFTSLADANYMNVESSEFSCRIGHGSSVYVDDEVKMAIQAPIPQPTTPKELFKRCLAEAGTPLNPIGSGLTPVPAPTQTAPAAPAPTAPASDGFVIPAVFEPVKTTDDITLYLDDGSHVTISYPSDSTYFKNAQFNHSGTYYATISCDISVGSGYAKFTLDELGSAEEYLDMQIDRFRKQASADSNRLTNRMGEIQTINVNGMEVSYVDLAYESVNAFKKQVTMELCFGVAQVGGKYLCVEFSNGYGQSNGNKVDFANPAEFLFSHVK